MECPQCRHSNSDQARFCNQCGTPLSLLCLQCHHENPAGSRFCNQCGRLLSSPPEARDTLQEVGPGGERRQATVLFSDLSGYTALNETLDPEEVEAIMRRIKEQAVQIVERYGGIVNQFVGDEILALFGIPHAHEDDPLRAVNAALALHALVRQIGPAVEARIGQPLRMHTGIHTGLIVTTLRDERDGRYGITGDTVNTGARLKALAQADEILISPAMQRLITPYFTTEALAAVRVKGKAQPLIPYRVVEAAPILSRFEAAEQRGFAPCTGRDQELASLHYSLGKAMQGEGEFVSVVGEAGIGKSRLLYEFRHSLDQERVTVWQGRCQSSRSDTPYFPFLDALRQGLHLPDEGALPETVATRIVAIDPSLEPFLPLYLHLLSIRSEYPLPAHMQGEELRQAIQEALSAILTLSARHRPLVLLLEDWHWSDEASQAALQHLIGMASSAPLLVVVTYRPELPANWGHRTSHTPLILKPLSIHHTERIIKSLIDASHLPEGFTALIHEQTAGNPLFIEEICYALLEEGILVVVDGEATLTQTLEHLALPDTVQAIIRTRLDRLPPAAQEVLRLGSVIGRVFGRRILERLYPDQVALAEALEMLQKTEMIQQIRVLPEAEYTFKHVLTQEVAYETLLRQRRKVLHGQVGKVMEELYQDRLEEQVYLLHHHFRLAEEWEKAVIYGRQAAESAERLSQFPEAVRMLAQTQTCLEQLPEDRSRQETLLDLLLRQERLYETLGWRDQQQAIIDQLLALLSPGDNPSCLAEVYVRQGELHTLLGRFAEAEQVLSQALALRRALSDQAGEAHVFRSIGFLRWHQGRYDDALSCNEAVLAIDRERGDLTAIATDLTNLGAVLRKLGHYTRALDCLEEARQLYASLHNLVKLAPTLYNIANVHRDRGDLEQALTYYRQAYDIHVRCRNLIGQAFTLTSIAHISWEQGKVQESLRLYQDVVQMTRDIRYGQGLLHALRMVGELLLVLNRPQDALPCLLEATTVATELKEQENEALIWSKVATIYEEHLQNSLEAFSAWEKVCALRRQLANPPGELEALQQMIRLSRHPLNAPEQAIRYLHEALDLARSLGDQVQQGELLNQLGILEWHQAAYTEALMHYEQARQIYEDLGDLVHLGLILNSLGVTLRGLRRHDEALVCLQEAVTTHQQTGQRLLEGHGLAAIGDVYYDLGRYDEAIHHYQASLEIRRSIDDSRGEGWMLHHLARVYAAQGSPLSAREYTRQALAIATECGDGELCRACTQLQAQL